MPSVAWLSWSTDAFRRARVERKPVLLSITTRWSQACRTMDAESYADPAVAALVEERFVPVRVDADRRPDISERYSLGGWPTTALLSADADLVGGGTFVPRAHITGVLRTMADAFGELEAEMILRAAASSGQEDDAPRPGTRLGHAELTRMVFSSFDPDYGGFGTAPKLPLAAPIRLALHLHHEQPDERLAHIATASLDAIGWGPLHDETDGGFFRCSEARTWEDPHLEKVLDVNAALVDLYVEAAGILRAERYAARAQDTLRYTQNCLADQAVGGWAGSQEAMPLAAVGRGALTGAAPRPAVDRTLYASVNGAMVSAALRAADAFQDDGLGAFALRSLEHLLAACYTPGAGVAHCVLGGVRTGGMLDDQIAVSAACLDAFDATGNIVYQMMAEELALHAHRTMWDARRGAFFDRAVAEDRERIGLMRTRLTPFVGNCQAAMALQRLAGSTGKHQFAEMAASILEAISDEAAGQGPHAAHYLLAVRGPRLR